MNRKRYDLLIVTLFSLCGLLVVLIAIAVGLYKLVLWGTDKLAEQPQAEEAVVMSPPTGGYIEEDAPDESEKILAALLEKCHTVEDCVIVGYSPELVAGWRPEWKNDCGMYLTASGMWVAPGYAVATDPEIIPTGATVIISGRVYVAADRGVKGKIIDVMVPVDEALTYGVRTETVYWCLEGSDE